MQDDSKATLQCKTASSDEGGLYFNFKGTKGKTHVDENYNKCPHRANRTLLFIVTMEKMPMW